MSVLIKDMEKPKSCYAVIDGEYEYCPFVNTDDDCVLLLKKGICERTWKGQYSKCPLIEASELCEDAVSRRMAIDAVKASTPFCVIPDDHHISAVDMEFRISKLPSVTPRPESCEDAVSRKSILDKIEEVCFSKKQEWVDFRVSQGSNGQRDLIIKFIESLPSIQQRPSISENPNKRKTGRWIHEIVNNYTEKTYCSECGESAPFVFVNDDYYGVHVHGEVRKTNFCPNCGVDMRGRQDDD